MKWNFQNIIIWYLQRNKTDLTINWAILENLNSNTGG